MVNKKIGIADVPGLILRFTILGASNDYLIISAELAQKEKYGTGRNGIWISLSSSSDSECKGGSNSAMEFAAGRESIKRDGINSYTKDFCYEFEKLKSKLLGVAEKQAKRLKVMQTKYQGLVSQYGAEVEKLEA